MDAIEFSRLSEGTLEALNRALDAVADTHEVEVLYQGGVLTLEVESPAPSKIVISPASAVSQIWISAQSTSFKLDWDPERGAFVLGETAEDLASLVGRLVGEDLGVGPLRL
jgi:iron-sulfur cluster assembly protein CyaY